MNSKKNNKTKPRDFIKISVIIVLIIALIAGVTAIGRFDSADISEMIKDLFSKGKGDGDSSSSEQGISGIRPAEESVSEVYWNKENDEYLSLIDGDSAYIRELRIITAYDENRSSESFTLSADSGKYRAESEAKLIINDGENVYYSSPEVSFVTSAKKFDITDELGITTLELLKQEIRTARYDVQVSDNKKYIRVTVYTYSNGDVSSEYDISVEYGVVMAEYHYMDGEIYRAVVTDSIAPLTSSENIFDIPSDTSDIG